jgi:hypothetical protein
LENYNHPLRELGSRGKVLLTRKLLAPLGWKIVLNLSLAVDGVRPDACEVIQDPFLDAAAPLNNATGVSDFLSESAASQQWCFQAKRMLIPGAPAAVAATTAVESFMHVLVINDDGSRRFSVAYSVVKGKKNEILIILLRNKFFFQQKSVPKSKRD